MRKTRSSGFTIIELMVVVAVIAVCPGGVGRAGLAGTVCTTLDVRLNIPHPFFDCARTRNCRGWQLHGSPLMVAVRLKCRTELASVCHRCLYCTWVYMGTVDHQYISK